MSVEHKGRLPAPFRNVKYCFRIYYWHVHLEYIGPLDELEHAGIITPDMRANILIKRPGKRRLTEDGHHFSCHRCATKADPTRTKVVLAVEDGERALSFPGVSDEFPYGLESQRRNLSEHLREGARDRPRDSGLEARSRAVGRFQRMARWTVSEKLIVVDWAWIARERAGR